MYQLKFDFRHSYAVEREGIVLPITLRSGTKSAQLAANLDTGATFCLFRNELTSALGLELTDGIPKRFRTVNGNFEAFGHEIEIEVLGVRTYSTVYFFADIAINKNVLGRIGWMDRVRLGIVEHDSMVYLAPYDVA